MPLNDQDRARVAEINANYYAYDNGNLMRSVRRLLSIIDRLSEQPEVVRCGECKNSSRIVSDPTGRMRHCCNGRGAKTGDGFSRVKQDGYCDEGERKEGEHETD